MRKRIVGFLAFILASAILVSLMVSGIVVGPEPQPPFEFDVNVQNTPLPVDVQNTPLPVEVTNPSGMPIAANVNVSSHASQLIYVAVDVTVYAGSYWDSGYISIDGFSKVTILIQCLCDPRDNQAWIFASDASHTTRFTVDLVNDIGFTTFPYVKTFDVMNQEIYITFMNDSTSDATLNVQIYLVA